MRGAIVSIHQGIDEALPILLPIRIKGSEHIQQSPVEPLRSSITLWVILRSPGLLHIHQFTHFPDYLTLEIGSLIRMDYCGHSILGDELIKENLCCCLGRLIPGWTC